MVWLWTSQTLYRGRGDRFYSTVYTIYVTRKPIKPHHFTLASVMVNGYQRWFSLFSASVRLSTTYSMKPFSRRRSQVHLSYVKDLCDCIPVKRVFRKLFIISSLISYGPVKLVAGFPMIIRAECAWRRCNIGKTHISHQCILFVAMGRLYNHYLEYYTVSGCYYFYIAMCIFFWILRWSLW